MRLTKTFVNLLFTVLSRTSTCGYEFKVIFMLETLNSHLKKRFWVATIVTCISVFILFLFLNYNLLKHELKNRKQRAHLLVEILKDKIMKKGLPNYINTLQVFLEDQKDSRAFTSVSFSKEISQSGTFLTRKDVPVIVSGQNIGYLQVTYNITLLYYYFFFSLFFLVVLFLLPYFFYRYYSVTIYKDLINPLSFIINKNTEGLGHLSHKHYTKPGTFKLSELSNFQNQILNMMKKFDYVIKEKEDVFKENQKLIIYKSLSQIARKLAHDIKKPFSKINILIDDMQSDTLKKGDLDNAKNALKKDLQILEGLLLDLIHLGNYKTLNQEDVSIRNLVENALDIVSSSYSHAQVKKLYDFHHRHLIFSDPNKILRALVNIIDNAFRATQFKGKIWFKTSETQEQGKDFLKLSIGNDGPIIPKDILKKIFSFSFSEGQTGGFGIGLASVKRVVEDYAGRVWCESNSDLGTEFSLLLPISKKKDNYVSSIESLPKEENTNFDFLSGKLNVLFVDDDSFYIEQIKNYCEKLSLNFHGFKSRKELNEKIEDINPDLALIDLTLDNDTYCGYKIAKQIQDLYPDCYTVVYSNHSAKLEESRVRESGVSKYIEKNMTFEGFREIASKAYKLKDALIKAKNKVIRTIVIDDEEFYLARWKRVHLENVKRFLSPRDFFNFFSEHKDELASYDIIICDYYFNGYDIVSSGFVEELKKTFNYQGIVALCSSFSIGHVDGFDLVLEKKVYSAKELSELVLKHNKNL